MFRIRIRNPRVKTAHCLVNPPNAICLILFDVVEPFRRLIFRLHSILPDIETVRTAPGRRAENTGRRRLPDESSHPNVFAHHVGDIAMEKRGGGRQSVDFPAMPWGCLVPNWVQFPEDHRPDGLFLRLRIGIKPVLGIDQIEQPPQRGAVPVRSSGTATTSTIAGTRPIWRQLASCPAIA